MKSSGFIFKAGRKAAPQRACFRPATNRLKEAGERKKPYHYGGRQVMGGKENYASCSIT